MLSAIVPTLNAESLLQQCLWILRDVDEIIIVDGGSSDATIAIAESADVRLVLSPKGRGTQLKAGGETAKGDWLLFLHADTILEPDWRRAVDAHIAAHPAKAACFRLRLHDPAWQARWIEKGVGWRVALLGLPYGDQALLIPRTLYDQVGGYSAIPLMEDVDLVRRIGRNRLRMLDAAATTSAERWQRNGWLRRSVRNLLCLALFRAGMSAERIARFYG